MRKKEKLTSETNNNPSRKKGSRIKNALFNFAIILAFIVGLAVLLYPAFSDWWNKRRNAGLISDYKEIMTRIDDDSYRLMMADARAYNEQHLVNTFIDAFEGEEGYMLRHPYDQLLNPMGNYVMGYIDVPKIGQRLTIGHGTGTEVLEKGVGHVEGSSLPVGGESSHSVLAGHRGLPSAEIFSDADQLAYEIDQIETVTPDNAEFLQIIEGEDLVTLLTCTPYGVNSHRMLIRGRRIPFVEADIQEQARQRRLPEREKPVVIAVAALIGFFLLLILVRMILAAKDRRKREAAMLARIEALEAKVKELEAALPPGRIKTEEAAQETEPEGETEH